VSILSGGTLDKVPNGEYVAIAGRAGGPPVTVAADDRPFSRSLRLDGTAVEIRMESWLAFDTIRRMGFGQVVAARRHALIVERGVSFVAFDGSGRPLQSGYFGNIFESQPRYLAATP
jgi:hypothetical protein